MPLSPFSMPSTACLPTYSYGSAERPDDAARCEPTSRSRPWKGVNPSGDVDAAGGGTVVEQRLYQLIRQPRPIADRRFEIEFLDAGVEAFAFTFG